MSKSIKTPALNNVEFAAENTEVVLRTFTSVVNGVQYVVEAESAEQAQALIEEQINQAQEEPETEINIEESANNTI